MSTHLRNAIAAALVVAAVSAVLLFAAGPRPNAASPVQPSATTRTPSGPTASVGTGLLAPRGYAGGGLIEFTRHGADGTDELWTIDPSGAHARLVLSGACCGLFSPDGRQLALAAPGVASPSLARDPTLLGVEVLDTASLAVAFAVPTECGACEMLGLNQEPDAWSADGRYIAMSVWSDTDPNRASMAIADRDFPLPWDWATGATGPSEHFEDIPIAFSPDSRELLFLRTERTQGPTSIGSLFVVQVADRSYRQVSPPGISLLANGLIQGPASWSPDGHQIAFAGRDIGGAERIYVVDSAPGATPRVLVDSAPGATSARFSPDGSVVAFDQAGANGFHDLYLVASTGGKPRDLTAAFDPGVCCAQWSPDGAAMLVAGTVSDDDHNDLFAIAADGSGIWQVTSEPNAYTGFLWGPAAPR